MRITRPTPRKAAGGAGEVGVPDLLVAHPAEVLAVLVVRGQVARCPGLPGEPQQEVRAGVVRQRRPQGADDVIVGGDVRVAVGRAIRLGHLGQERVELRSHVGVGVLAVRGLAVATDGHVVGGLSEVGEDRQALVGIGHAGEGGLALFAILVFCHVPFPWARRRGFGW